MCVCVRAVGAPFTIGTGAHPQTVWLLKWGLGFSLLPFAVRHINDRVSLQTTAEMDCPVSVARSVNTWLGRES